MARANSHAFSNTVHDGQCSEFLNKNSNNKNKKKKENIQYNLRIQLVLGGGYILDSSSLSSVFSFCLFSRLLFFFRIECFQQIPGRLFYPVYSSTSIVRRE
ncbi:hypothetical protein CEXT_649231 [Caerostris extrusa]|uniref:Uncharacterized protein n=1 Tax=Caerostris extrusa TaxID=172846 RepID=A0AAV4NU30_CAEEX|nr:hypothetical protein CEXT_649231 [Caerostris extrusa]